MTTLPVRADDLTAAWLSDSLGVTVTGVEVLDEAVATNQRVRLALRYDRPGDGPETLFVKLASADPEHRKMIGAGEMGEREVRFYEDVAPGADLRLPRSYFGACGDDGCFVLLLEDLTAAGCRFLGGVRGVTADEAAGALEDLARFHARFEDPAVRSSVAPWAASPGVGHTEFAAGLLAMVLDQHHDELTPSYVEAGRLYVEHHDRITARWDSGPRTFVHGDPHIGNVFLDGPRVGFFDWGLSRASTHLRDVSYFLTMTVDPAERRAAEADLLRLYLGALAAAGGTAIDFDEAWFEHRVQAAYTVVATFLAFMPTYLASDVQVLATDLLRRAEMALDDLEVVPALRRALD
ncbi:MAG: phosphotransferase [Acidobacteriota bacterium]|nr:phosphotransferase [Acidobacteriota bacterium]